jgi:hypothetical protein
MMVTVLGSRGGEGGWPGQSGRVALVRPDPAGAAIGRSMASSPSLALNSRQVRQRQPRLTGAFSLIGGRCPFVKSVSLV